MTFIEALMMWILTLSGPADLDMSKEIGLARADAASLQRGAGNGGDEDDDADDEELPLLKFIKAEWGHKKISNGL